MSKNDMFAPLEQRETPTHVERTYAYGPATIVERVPHSEIGDDYEVLEKLLFITPGGRKVSAQRIADISKLRFAIERDDVSEEQSGFGYHNYSKTIALPRSIVVPRSYKKNGVPRNHKHISALWSLPGCWLTLLHEIGHAEIAHSDEVRHRRDLEYTGRMNAIFDAVVARDISVEIDHDRFIAYTIRAERDAWAWALRVLRRYREFGIDFEPELDTNKKLDSHIHISLATYITRMLVMMDEEENLESYVVGINKTLSGDPTSKLKYNNEYLFAGR